MPGGRDDGASEGEIRMQPSPVSDCDQEARCDAIVSLLDPQRYVREADCALTNGRRDDSIALIAQAYLAFDLLNPGCGVTTRSAQAKPERSS